MTVSAKNIPLDVLNGKMLNDLKPLIICMGQSIFGHLPDVPLDLNIEVFRNSCMVLFIFMLVNVQANEQDLDKYKSLKFRKLTHLPREHNGTGNSNNDYDFHKPNRSVSSVK